MFAKREFILGAFPEPYLLAATGTRIAMVDLKTNYSKFIFNQHQYISNLVIDPFDEKMYFKSGRKVYRTNFDGSDKEVIFPSSPNSSLQFALDWVERRMYYRFERSSWWQSKYVSKRIVYVGNLNFTEGRIFGETNQKFSTPALDPYARQVILLATLLFSGILSTPEKG